MADVLLRGHRSANTIFLPSYDTSGSDTSPLPCVIAAVTLNSRAEGDERSRMMRSPPAANGAPLVGLMRTAVERLAYAMGTSPDAIRLSAFGSSSDDEQPASATSAATAIAVIRREGWKSLMAASLEWFRLGTRELSDRALVSIARGNG